MTDVFWSVWYAVRQMKGAGSFTLASIIIIAIGASVNIAIAFLSFSLFSRPLPVAEPHSLLQVTFHVGGDESQYLSGPLYESLRRHQQVLEDLFEYQAFPVVLSQGPKATQIDAAEVSGNAFRVLGIRPQLGRLLGPEDDRVITNSGYAVVLSFKCWTDNYNRDPKAIGKQLHLNKQLAVIVGVAPPTFSGILIGQSPQFYLPSSFSRYLPFLAADLSDPGASSLLVVGRRRPQVTMIQVESELKRNQQRILSEAFPLSWAPHERYMNGELNVKPAEFGVSYFFTSYKEALIGLRILVGALLLVCCLTLASWQWSRALTLKHEIAIFVALGASRMRLLLQTLSQSIVLAATGTIAGLFLSAGIYPLLTNYVGTLLGRNTYLPFTLNSYILWYCFVLCLLIAFFSGLIPVAALFFTYGSGTSLIKESSPQARSGSPTTLLTVAGSIQVSAAFVSIVLALLFATNLHTIEAQAPELQTDAVVLTTLDTSQRPETTQALTKLYTNLLDCTARIAGVRYSAIATIPLLSGQSFKQDLKTITSGGLVTKGSILENAVSQDYFSVLGLRLLAGRSLDRTDYTLTSNECLLSRSAAKTLFQDGQALGKMIYPANVSGQLRTEGYEVVGVVEDTKYLSLTESTSGTMYLPFTRLQEAIKSMTLLIRSDAAHPRKERVGNAIEQCLPGVPLTSMLTLREQADAGLGRERLLSKAAFGLQILTVVLSAISVHTLLSTFLARQSRSIAIRMAIGAKPSQVISLLLNQIQLLLIPGVCLGLLTCVAIQKRTAAILFQANAAEPRFFLGALAILLGATLCAAYVPLRRAMKLSVGTELRVF